MNHTRYQSIAFDRLPKFPLSIARVLRHVKDPEISPDNLQNLLAPDEELCDNVIRLANCPLFSYRGSIQSLGQAIACLGREGFHELLFTIAALSLFRDGLPVFDAARLRMHSLACGILSREIARRVRLEDPGTAFRAGLLHDIGLIAIGSGPREAFSQAAAAAMARRLPLITMEEATLGFHHGQCSFWYGERLDLESSVLHAIRFHHEPEGAPPPRGLTAAVCLGDLLTRSGGFGFGIDEEIVSPAILDRHPAWEILRCEQLEIRSLNFWNVASKLLEDLDQIREDVMELCGDPIPA